MRLTKQQEEFVKNLAKGDTQRVAFRKAYPKNKSSDKTIDESASKMLAKPKVNARFSELMHKVAKETEEDVIITTQEVLKEIKDMLSTDIADIADIVIEDVVVRDPVTGEPLLKEDGSVATELIQRIRVKTTDEMSKAALKSISEIGYDSNGRIKIKRYDKQKTIDQAAKTLGMYLEKIEHSGEIKMPTIKITK